MAQASLVEEGIDRLRSAADSVEGEVRKVRRDVRRRTRELSRRAGRARRQAEKRLEDGRQRFEKQARESVDAALGKVRKSEVYRRTEGLRKDAARAYESGIESLWSALNVASKADLDRLERKLGQLGRKLRELEKERAAAPPAAREKREPASGASAS